MNKLDNYKISYEEEILLYKYAQLHNPDNLPDALMVAATLRIILVDQLFHVTNKHHKLLVEFESIVSDTGFNPPFCLLSVNDKYIDYIEGAKKISQKLDAFLKTPIWVLKNRDVSVLELIKFAANARGGVHYDIKLKGDEEKLYADFEKDGSMKIENFIIIGIGKIADIVSIALRPLVNSILKLKHDDILCKYEPPIHLHAVKNAGYHLYNHAKLYNSTMKIEGQFGFFFLIQFYPLLDEKQIILQLSNVDESVMLSLYLDSDYYIVATFFKVGVLQKIKSKWSLRHSSLFGRVIALSLCVRKTEAGFSLWSSLDNIRLFDESIIGFEDVYFSNMVFANDLAGSMNNDICFFEAMGVKNMNFERSISMHNYFNLLKLRNPFTKYES